MRPRARRSIGSGASRRGAAVELGADAPRLRRRSKSGSGPRGGASARAADRRDRPRRRGPRHPARPSLRLHEPARPRRDRSGDRRRAALRRRRPCDGPGCARLLASHRPRPGTRGAEPRPRGCSDEQAGAGRALSHGGNPDPSAMGAGRCAVARVGAQINLDAQALRSTRRDDPGQGGDPARRDARILRGSLPRGRVRLRERKGRRVGVGRRGRCLRSRRARSRACSAPRARDEWVGLEPSGRIVGLGAGMPSVCEDDPRPVDELSGALALACPGSRCLATLSLRLDRSGRAHLVEVHLGIGGDALADQLLPAALPGFDVFDALVAVQVGRSIAPPPPSPRARGLVRAESGWRLIEAWDATSLREAVRATLPPELELPASLVDAPAR